VTFSPHPAQILRPTEAPKLLTDRDQKLRLLESTGIDAVVMIAFDRIQAQETPEDFVKRVLVDALDVKCLIVGEDFCFGKDRRGNVELLTQQGEHYGFVVEPSHLVAGHDDVTASSTYIRSLVQNGDIEAANMYLGRQHELAGTVVHGDARGRTVGFPTANVEVPKMLGVLLCRVKSAPLLKLKYKPANEPLDAPLKSAYTAVEKLFKLLFLTPMLTLLELIEG
jgi:riboflavin kinase/FMN adenylyltransferase